MLVFAFVILVVKTLLFSHVSAHKGMSEVERVKKGSYSNGREARTSNFVWNSLLHLIIAIKFESLRSH